MLKRSYTFLCCGFKLDQLVKNVYTANCNTSYFTNQYIPDFFGRESFTFGSPSLNPPLVNSDYSCRGIDFQFIEFPKVINVYLIGIIHFKWCKLLQSILHFNLWFYFTNLSRYCSIYIRMLMLVLQLILFPF